MKTGHRDGATLITQLRHFWASRPRWRMGKSYSIHTAEVIDFESDAFEPYGDLLRGKKSKNQDVSSLNNNYFEEKDGSSLKERVGLEEKVN